MTNAVFIIGAIKLIAALLIVGVAAALAFRLFFKALWFISEYL